MSIINTREIIGEPEIYHSHRLAIFFDGIDWGVLVDGQETDTRYLSQRAAIEGARRYVDDLTSGR